MVVVKGGANIDALGKKLNKQVDKVKFHINID